MSRPVLPQHPQSNNASESTAFPDNMKLSLFDNIDFSSHPVTPLEDLPRSDDTQSVGRLSIENVYLAHQNGNLAHELAHTRYTIHALRQIVSQKEAAEQRVQNEHKQSLWRIRVLEAVVGRMSEQLVLLMGEQRGGFDEGTDVVGLAREVAVGEFYRQHAALQQRELDAIRSELGGQEEDFEEEGDEEEEEEEEEDYDDDSKHLPSSTSEILTGKVSPPPPMITVTDSDAESEQPPTFDNDQSPSSSSSDDDDLDFLEETEEQFGTAPVRSLDPSTKSIYDAEPTVLGEERPGLRAEVLFARMRIVAGEV